MAKHTELEKIVLSFLKEHKQNKGSVIQRASLNEFIFGNGGSSGDFRAIEGLFEDLGIIRKLPYAADKYEIQNKIYETVRQLDQVQEELSFAAFDETEEKVLRFLHKRFITDEKFVNRAFVGVEMGLTPDLLNHIEARFEERGIIKEIDLEGDYQVMPKICELVSILDNRKAIKEKISSDTIPKVDHPKISADTRYKVLLGLFVAILSLATGAIPFMLTFIFSNKI